MLWIYISNSHIKSCRVSLLFSDISYDSGR